VFLAQWVFSFTAFIFADFPLAISNNQKGVDSAAVTANTAAATIQQATAK